MWLNLFKNEFVKTGRTNALLLLLAVPLAWVVFPSLLLYSLDYEDFLRRISSTHNDPDPYHYIFRWFRGLIGMSYSVYVCLLVLYFSDSELKNNAWKYLAVLPVQVGQLLAVKLVVVATALFLALVINWASLVGAMELLAYLKPDFLFDQYPADYHVLGLLFFKLFYSSLPLIPVFFMLSHLIGNQGILLVVAFLLPMFYFEQLPFAASGMVLSHYFELQEDLSAGFDFNGLFQIHDMYTALWCIALYFLFTKKYSLFLKI